MRRKSICILIDLRNREYHRKSNLRRNLAIVRKIVCQPDVKFKKIWQRNSKQPISYENGRLYFENFRRCYHSCGHGNLPQPLYALPSCAVSQKIEDCLMCSSPLDSIPLEHKAYRPHMIALTAHNWLIRYDTSTGQALEQVFLGPCNRYKFKHVSWNMDVQSFSVKSVQCRGGQDTSRNILLCIAVFSVFPLRFTGMLEITRSVFGSDVSDAMISQNCLITMHHGGRVKLFSMEHIIEQGLLYEAHLHKHCNVLNGVVGCEGVGLPLNIKLKAQPEVLFSIRCAEHSICLGGFPWHYIISKPNESGIFRVFNLSSQEMAINGRLEMPGISIEPDKCMFHADDSGRLLHIGDDQLKVMRLDECLSKAISGENVTQRSSEMTYRLKQEFVIKPRRKETSQDTQPSYTSSGRQVKRTRYSEDVVDCEHPCLRNVDYEDDLDLMLLTSVTTDNDQYQGHVYLHDNQSGNLLKEIEFEDPWAEFCDHGITLDMDTLIHLIKAPKRHFYCVVYRMQRTCDDSVEDVMPKKPRRRRTKAQSPREET